MSHCKPGWTDLVTIGLSIHPPILGQYVYFLELRLSPWIREEMRGENPSVTYQYYPLFIVEETVA